MDEDAAELVGAPFIRRCKIRRRRGKNVGTGIGTGQCGTASYRADGDLQKSPENLVKSLLGGSARIENTRGAALLETGALAIELHSYIKDLAVADLLMLPSLLPKSVI